jgi:hypothetical protein
MTSIARHMAVAALASTALAGCANCSLDALRSWGEPRRSEARTAAVERKAADHAALKGTEAPQPQAVVDITEEKRKWCGQRFIDYQDGKRPGGAQTVEQKQADDRICEALKQGEQNEKIETGSIPKR